MHHFQYKCEPVMYREIITAYFEITRTHKHTRCEISEFKYSRM